MIYHAFLEGYTTIVLEQNKTIIEIQWNTMPREEMIT
jgi:hypothetical protein